MINLPRNKTNKTRGICRVYAILLSCMQHSHRLSFWKSPPTSTIRVELNNVFTVISFNIITVAVMIKHCFQSLFYINYIVTFGLLCILGRRGGPVKQLKIWTEGKMFPSNFLYHSVIKIVKASGRRRKRAVFYSHQMLHIQLK